MESILTSIKKLLGPGAMHEHFDPDIIMHINTVFLDLTQIGVGPSSGFAIEDETSTWTEFIPANSLLFEAVKSYVYLRVRLLFDPPTISSVTESINKEIARLEWRLNLVAETVSNE